MQKLLLASNNPGKLREILAILANLNLKILQPAALGLKLEVLEDGSSFLENASKKALAFAEASGMAVLADDSGLEVKALNGAPGIHSHRFNPQPNANDADRCNYLLKQLENIPQPWYARFVCTVVISLPGRSLVSFEGDCRGQIVPEAKGLNGFGYDPIFQVEGLEETMAQLPDNIKNHISHRAVALGKALPYLSLYAAHAL